MPLTTFDDLFTQAEQREARFYKVSGTVVANAWYTTIHLAGWPAAAALDASVSASGDLVNSGDGYVWGYSYPFGGRIEPGVIRTACLESTVALRGRWVDVLFRLGAIPASAGTTTPATPPTIPLDYPDNELWVWTFVAPTGTLSLNVTYLNEAGVSKSTGAVSLTLSGAVGRMARIPLAAGDRAVTKIVSVVRSGATAGSVTLVVLAPLWRGRVPVANGLVRDGMDQTGLGMIRKDPACMLMVNSDSTASGETDATLFVSSSA